MSEVEREAKVICVMGGVREYGGDGEAVELCRHRNGRLVIRAYNEGGNNVTEVDLFDLIAWLQGEKIITASQST